MTKPIHYAIPRAPLPLSQYLRLSALKLLRLASVEMSPSYAMPAEARTHPSRGQGGAALSQPAG